MSDLTSTKSVRWWLAAIFVLALGMRLWGISWGLPERLELHPDEHDYVMTHALIITPHNLDPGWYNYPSFLMYLTAIASGILRRLGMLSQEWQCYLTGRVISALFGAGTSLVMYRLARELGGSVLAGLLAAFWMALFPLNVWESHVAVTDPLMTFWSTMTVWTSVRLIRTATLRDYLLAGTSLGLAIGSKYTAAIAVVAILAGALGSFLERKNFVSTFKGLCVAGAASLFCAFAVTPYSFIHFRTLQKAMAYEHNHTIGHHSGFSVPAAGHQYHRYIYQVFAAWPFSFGIALYACAIAGVIWALFRFDRRKLVPLAFCAVFFGITGSWTFTPIRYYLPIIVLGCAFAGLWQAEWFESQSKLRRMIALVATLACAAYTLIFTAQTSARYADETRVQAGRWLDTTPKTGTSLLVCGWSRYMGMPADTNRIVVRGGEGSSEGRAGNTKKLQSEQLIEITSLCYSRHYRVGDAAWIEAYRRLRDPNGLFEQVAKFESPFINKRLYMKLDPMFGGYFVSPTLEFYRPKNPIPREAETNAIPNAAR